MPESSQEKTEDATPRRLREAREKGQVPKSRDISQVFVMIIIFGTLAMTIAFMGSEYQAYFRLCIEALSHPEIDGGVLYDLGKAGVVTLFKTMAPMLIAGMVTGLISGMAQVGAMFATDPLMPKFEKLNPIEGLKNMFKVTTLIELIKNILKIGIVFYVAYSTIYKALGDVLLTMRVDMLSAAKLTGGMIFEFILKVSVFFIFISMIDYFIQRWNFMKNMRMSKDEVKREYKQDEGDPAIKGERRRLHREMAFGDVKKAVKQADAVVTNPTHLACVIEYNKDEMAAPQLTAKGQNMFAETIVNMAREEGVPILRNIPLAWSLIHLEIGDEIPEELYEAVAEVLTIVHEMKEAKNNPSGPSNPVYA